MRKELGLGKTLAAELSFEVSGGGRGERAGKKLAKLLHHGLEQHVQDVEIHGQLLCDSTAMKLLFHAMKPGRIDFGGNKSLSVVGHCSAR